MIQTKDDLKLYLDEDRKAYGKKPKYSFQACIANKLFPDNNWEYVKCLRKLEYAVNNQRLSRYYYTWRLQKLRAKTGIQLLPNVAGPGLHILHGNIVVHENAKLGRNCKIAQFVTVGCESRYDRSGAPTIGDRVFIGAGAAIIGDVMIADEVVIGANAVVTKDILEPGITVAGAPAKKISAEESFHYLNR